MTPEPESWCVRCLRTVETCALLLFHDPTFAQDVARVLAPAGVRAFIVPTEALCLERLRYRPWDSCLVDAPDIARSLRRRLRTEEIDVPVSTISRRSELELGRAASLLVLEAAGKKQARPRGIPLVCVDLTIDPRSFDGYVGNQPLELTRREFQILYMLALNRGKALAAAEIAHRIGLPDTGNIRKNITTQMTRLRHKIRERDCRARISNLRGVGWMLDIAD